ncbi:hypothetical protein F5Y16DRAFT_377536 [Xylariaceae sp. FL0255]|nr:hypothetical protein F5Y16DRAFT_377536 [Xylariaceae sp. FL0255]
MYPTEGNQNCYYYPYQPNSSSDKYASGLPPYPQALPSRPLSQPQRTPAPGFLDPSWQPPPPPLTFRPSSCNSGANSPNLNLSPYHPNSNTGAPPPASSAAGPLPPLPSPRNLELVPQGHGWAVRDTNNPDGSRNPFMIMTWASDSSVDKAPDLLAYRGSSFIENPIAVARITKFTYHGELEMPALSNNTDIHNDHGTNASKRMIKLKRGHFDSSVGPGGGATWTRDGRHAMKLVLDKNKNSGGGDQNSPTARFEAAPSEKLHRGSGRLEILWEGLGRDQIEEIVLTCMVERERMRRAEQMAKSLVVQGLTGGLAG